MNVCSGHILQGWHVCKVVVVWKSIAGIQMRCGETVKCNKYKSTYKLRFTIHCFRALYPPKMKLSE